jgi:hypothetical protein
MEPTTYRIALSPFLPIGARVRSVVGDLGSMGFLPDQLCLVAMPSAIAPLSPSVGSGGGVFAGLFANVEDLQVAAVSSRIVASVGPIADVLLKQQSWLSSPAAAPLRVHIESGGIVVAVNGLDHGQFVDAARLLLKHGSGNLSTHIFRWP